ncbi:hypothetical protein EXIGLDRAFT_732097 [Exidia glandulosa HHB12029]|uniref:Uncharacterized protein n=1 Tax=Exidia glandulosa HHB12029 TaxID=1314781 RepID=A0A165BMW0_EXIGL|nr:hypothetical protein EXIGLDRAFT_732097 [Exidia glandulosa HHB12029]
MRCPQLLLALFALAPLTSAYIYSIAPIASGFTTNPTTSSLPVVFTTGGSKVEFYDLAISFGLSTPAEHNTGSPNNTIGKPIFTVDLLAMGRSSTGAGQLAIQVPLCNSDLYNGEGSYILTAAVMRGTGSMRRL